MSKTVGDNRASLMRAVTNLEAQLAANKQELAALADRNVAVNQLNLVIARVNELAKQYGADKKKLDDLRRDALKGQDMSKGPLEKRRNDLLKELDVLSKDNDRKLSELNTVVTKAQGTLDQSLRDKFKIQGELESYEKVLDVRMNALIGQYIQLTGSVSNMNQNVDAAIQKMRQWLNSLGG